MAHEDLPESSPLGKGPCDACGSSDANVEYDDGHFYCFSCKKTTPAPSDGEPRKAAPKVAPKGNMLQRSRFIALTKRGIEEATCRKFGYAVAEFSGQHVHVAPYHNADGVEVAQKVRFPSKDFTQLGETKVLKTLLFGAHMWRSGGKRIVITEGEIDALSVAQAMSLTWPVVSVPTGAQGAAKAIAANLEVLEQFEEVVLWFDNDDPGRAAVAECADLFTPGRLKVAHVAEKDANETLLKRGSKAVLTAVWDAKAYRPDGIIAGGDISLDDLMVSTGTGFSTPYPDLDKKIGGIRKGELTLLTAGTGIGKSTIAREISYYLLRTHGLTIGNVYLEESIEKTAKGYIAIHNNVPLGKLRGDPTLLTREQWDEGANATIKTGRCHFYSHFGSMDSENLLGKLRYMAVSLGCDFILLDHISIVVSGMESSREGERKDIDRLVTRLRQLVENTGVGIIAISHLSKAEGKSHEEGGRVTLNDLRGSASLKQLPDTIVALERDQQGDSPDDADIRVLKCREHGEVGLAGTVTYNKATGRLLPKVEGADITEDF